MSLATRLLGRRVVSRLPHASSSPALLGAASRTPSTAQSHAALPLTGHSPTCRCLYSTEGSSIEGQSKGGNSEKELLSNHWHRKENNDTLPHKRSFQLHFPPVDSTPGSLPPIERRGGLHVHVTWEPHHLSVRQLQGVSSPVRRIEPHVLRDACQCPDCRNPSSGQKSFATTQIPQNLKIKEVRLIGEEDKQKLGVTFDNDIPRPGKSEHEMVVDADILERLSAIDLNRSKEKALQHIYARTGFSAWDKGRLAKEVRYIDYNDYMNNEDAMWDAVMDLMRLGIVFLKNIPEDPNSIVKVTERIANIKETFYGRTFDVRAKPDAENVAYTSDYLGLHQDLLYLRPSPKIQILHCLENSCQGGESLFSDIDRVGRLFHLFRDQPVMSELLHVSVPYEYTKNGFMYKQSRRLITSRHGNRGYAGVNWSPPFQGVFDAQAEGSWRKPYSLARWAELASLFEKYINQESAVFTRRMNPGDCVLFDNMRVAHGRTAFDAAGGSRWLRGAYIGDEDFNSRASHVPTAKLAEGWAKEGRRDWNVRLLLKTALLKEIFADLQKIDPQVKFPTMEISKLSRKPMRRSDEAFEVSA